MPLEGFVEYKRREFCNDVKCPVQIELNNCRDSLEMGSVSYSVWFVRALKLRKIIGVSSQAFIINKLEH